MATTTTTTNKPIFSKECSSHKEEPIIRASLDLKANKLFYCHECMEGLPKNSQADLIKFSQLADKLHEQISERYEQILKVEMKTDLANLNINKEEFTTKLDLCFSTQKERVEQEIDKIKTQVLDIFDSCKQKVNSDLDKIKGSIQASFVAYTEKVNNVINIKTSNELVVNKEDLMKEIQANEDTKETEKKVKARLESIKRADEIKEGTIVQFLESEKAKIEGMMNNFALVYTKDAEFYKQALTALGGYCQGLLFTESQEKPAPTFIGNQKELLDKLKDAVKGAQIALQKAADQERNYVEGVNSLCQTGSTSVKPKEPSGNIALRPAHQNIYYDEDFSVEDDDEEIPEEGEEQEIEELSSDPSSMIE